MESLINKVIKIEHSFKIEHIDDYKTLLDKSVKKDITDIVEILLSGAIALNASDIHLEPTKETANIRIRLDGLLQNLTSIDLTLYQRIVSRLKLLSSLKLNIDKEAQDGRFSIDVKEEENIQARTSSIPTNYGESIVIRILDSKNLLDIEKLGLSKHNKEILETEIQKPHGMILITGPTGSGKTTSLYAILKKINNPESKIITIEDPIEYKLEGITQTQVKEKYSFSEGLRSIVRQDPDVILVGEIRDTETAQTAIQSALTGHLVLSTLHTNDAVGTIARLQALKIEDHNIGPAVNIIIAQRLVRKLCSCAKTEKISKDLLKEFKSALPHTKIPEEIKTPVGCKKCNNTGYKGRIGIYEILIIDKDIENAITKKESIINILDLAIKNGFIGMYKDAILKVIEQKTSYEEILKVISK